MTWWTSAKTKEVRQFHPSHTVGLLLSLMIAIPLLASCSSGVKNTEVAKKLLLPSTKTVPLQAGTYAVWIFYKWKSKSVDSPKESLPAISLKGSSGTNFEEDQLQREKETDNILQFGQDPDHKGVLISILTLDSPGSISVSGSNPVQCVAVFAPQTDSWLDLSSDELLYGDNDDSGFVN